MAGPARLPAPDEPASSGQLAPSPPPEAPSPPNQPSGSPVAAGTYLGYWLEVLPEGQAEGFRVAPDSVFHSGDRVRIHFLSGAAGNLTISQRGASGAMTILYPDAGKGQADNLLGAAEERIFPLSGAWFRFDQQRGTEELFVQFTAAATLSGAPTGSTSGEPQVAAGLPSPEAQKVAGKKDLYLDSGSGLDPALWTVQTGRPSEAIFFAIALRHE